MKLCRRTQNRIALSWCGLKGLVRMHEWMNRPTNFMRGRLGAADYALEHSVTRGGKQFFPRFFFQFLFSKKSFLIFFQKYIFFK